MNHLDVDQLHLEVPLGDQLLAGVEGGRAGIVELRFPVTVFRSCPAEDLSAGRAAHIRGRVRGNRAKNLAKLGSTLGTNHDLLTPSVIQLRQTPELAQERIRPYRTTYC